MFSFKHFCSRCRSINCLVFGNSTDTSFNTSSAISIFRFSIFVVSVLLASALGLNPKYPSDF